MKKRILIIPLLIILLLSGCADKNTAVQNTEKLKTNSVYHFTFVCPIMQNEYWESCIEGITQADKELGTSTKIIGPQTAESFSTEIVNYMEQAIEEKPDGIMVYAGIEELYPLIEQATNQGTPVLALDSDAPSTSRIAYMGFDSYSEGYIAGEKMIELTNGKAKIGVLVSSSSAQKEMDVVEAFKDTIHDYNIEIVAMEETDADADIAAQKTREMLEENPDITAIFNTAGYNVTGAARVKKELGRDDLVLIGFDDVEENVEFVRENIINALIVQNIRQAGYQSVYLMKEYIEDGKLSKDSYDAGITVVTNENVDTYNVSIQPTNSENKIVRVGYYSGDTNFQDGFDDETRKSGYAYEYYQQIAAVAGWDYEYVYGTREDIVSKVKNGEIDIAAGIYKTDDLRSELLFSSSDIGLDGIKQYFVINPNRTDLLNELNDAMNQIQQLNPDLTVTLLHKYYNRTSVQVINDAEKEWLTQKGSLKIGYINNNLPISNMDDDGNPTGLVKVLIEQLSDYMHIEIEPFCFDTIDAMKESLKNGEIDAAFPIYSDLWMNEIIGFSQTEAVLSDRVMVIYKGNYSNDLLSNVALSKTGLGQITYLKKYYPDSEITFYDTRQETLEAIKSGNQKCVIGCSNILQNILKENTEYQDLNVAYLDVTESFCMAVKDNNSMLLGILNKSICHMDEAIITNAMIKYSDVETDYTFADFLKRYSLPFIALLIGIIDIIAIIFIAYIRKATSFNKIQTQTNKKLETALADANEANKAKTVFLSSMSHDIRTPMNAIIGMTSIAQKSMDNPDKVSDCLDKIDLSSHHLLTLINNILDISKIESGKLQLNESNISLSTAINSMLEIVKGQASSKCLQLNTNISKIEHDIVYADEVRINQIFMNILTNAIKYTPKGESIDLSFTEEVINDETARITYIVKDTGIGMSEEFMQSMYDTFTRAKDSRIDRIQGTGLGLSIVKQMVDLMGGSIDCKSEVGKGTEFRVVLDLPIVKIEDGESSLNSDNANGDDNDISNRCMLIAEDNDLNWEVISELLDMYGITVDRAENGQICVDMITNAPVGKYDLILMDIQMPVMNGLEATKAIRQSELEHVRNIPIIAMTADAFAEDINASLNAGMNGHVSKPVDINKLFQEIKKAFDKINEQ